MSIEFNRNEPALEGQKSPLFDRAVGCFFAALILAQCLLGLIRARMLTTSLMPALALAALLGAIGVLWFLKRRQLTGGFLARPAAVVFLTVGVLSAISALNAPFIGFWARFSMPMFAFATASVLAVARLSPRAHLAPLLALLVAFIALEWTLTHEARWESSSGQTSPAPAAVASAVHTRGA